jgi:small subunit ribosomal protein S2
MPETSFNELLDAGVHFGHLKRKWNPAMAPYIFMEKNGIHIIDLNKTAAKLKEAASAMKQIAKSGRKILFVATKKQAKDIVAEKVKAINMPYVTERWPGGMLTNFPTIRKAVKKMSAIDKMAADGTFDTLSKRERLQITRQRAKLEKNLGSIADLTRLPAAMFVVDVHKEYIAVREANRLNIPVFAMVDTNSDPKNIDFPIPANDDASKSISLIINYVSDAIAEGLNERRMEKEKEEKEAKAKTTAKPKEEGEKEVKHRTRRSQKVEIEAEASARVTATEKKAAAATEDPADEEDKVGDKLDLHEAPVVDEAIEEEAMEEEVTEEKATEEDDEAAVSVEKDEEEAAVSVEKDEEEDEETR